MLWSYRILLWLLVPAILGYTFYRAVKDGGWRYLRQRLGWGFPRRNDRPVWIHCASVGEVAAAEPLIRSLREREPTQPLIVTTVTPTGGKLAQSRLPDPVQHYYLPADWPSATKRFVDRLAPRCAWIMETELWPSLYAQCRGRGIPLIIVNGRLSDRTLNARAFMRRAYSQALGGVTAVLARSAADKEGFIRLGAPPARVEVIGNIKYAPPNDIVFDRPDPIGRPYWLAASTHDDEELRLARLYRNMAARAHVLVIAPRHPERAAAILKQLAELDLSIAVRSREEPVTADTQIYLADTLGELPVLMSHAEFVFMGGSLIPRGGHNILEPARLGRAIVVGPHMSNFDEETQALKTCEGLIQVKDDGELALAVSALQADEKLRDETGRRAQGFMEQQADIVSRYLERLTALCALDPRNHGPPTAPRNRPAKS